MGTPPSQSGSLANAAEVLPRRFTWLRRILIGCGVLLLLLIGLRLVWGYAAQRALDAKIAELRAAGYGVYPEDAPADDVERSEKTVEFWIAAASALPPPPARKLDRSSSRCLSAMSATIPACTSVC